MLMFSFDLTSALSMSFYIALALAIVVGCIIGFKRGGPPKQNWHLVHWLLIFTIPFIAGLFVAGGAGSRASPFNIFGLVALALLGTAAMVTVSILLWSGIFKAVDRWHSAYGAFRQLTFNPAPHRAPHAVEPTTPPARPEAPTITAVPAAPAPKAAAA